jgi:hypothetical protein
MIPRAVATHDIPGRLRLYIPDRIHDVAYFQNVQQAIKSLERIQDVRTNPTTGSILILHHSALEPIAQRALDFKLFEVAEREKSGPRSAAQYVEQAIALEGIAENLIRLDPTFRNITLGALVGAGLYQAIRGSFLPAGLTIFAYAIAVLNRSRT